jgi:SHS2 domain-containing protein
MDPAFVILEHPSDIGIEATGASLASAFEHAAEGLMSVILDTSAVEAREEREVTIAAADQEQLLVRWLSELLYLYDGKGFVGKRFDITRISPVGLQARVGGEELDPERHRTRLDVKAVTYHQLLLRQDDRGAMVRVFLDI